MTDVLKASEIEPTAPTGLDIKDDLAMLAHNHVSDLTVSPEELCVRSDKYIELAARQSPLRAYPRLARLSVINGSEFVEGNAKSDIHRYVYSDEFDKYASRVKEQVTEEGTLEKHFFIHGLEIGIWLKHTQ